jgi:hypothetical protein
MSDRIGIGLEEKDFDEHGNARIKVRLPCDAVITILVSDFGPEGIGGWIEPNGMEFGLNLVTEGHYT